MARKQAQKSSANGMSSAKENQLGQQTLTPDSPDEGAVMVGSAQMGENERSAIEVAAYYIAEKRGFSPGQEMEDWLQAESIVKRHEGQV